MRPPTIKEGVFRHNGIYNPHTHTIEVLKQNPEAYLYHELIHATRQRPLLLAFSTYRIGTICHAEYQEKIVKEEIIANIATYRIYKDDFIRECLLTWLKGYPAKKLPGLKRLATKAIKQADIWLREHKECKN
jgi:hypothetical protein